MNAKKAQVDLYIRKSVQWGEAMARLRAILNGSGLAEDLKWGVPCYTLGGSNVVLIHEFKAYCALLFHKGALMKDPEGLLVQQTKNVQAARQIRFTDAGQVDEQEAVLKAYVREAIELEQAGRKVAFKPTAEFEMPEEFQSQLDERPALSEAFHALTPGRQRGYLLHFSSAKQAGTRAARVEKCMPKILAGKGLDDE